MALQSINPATDQLVAEHPETTPDEVTRILRAARAASGSWRRTAPPERAASLRRAGALLRARKDELARMMAVEMGKPLAQGRAEAEKCAWVCDYYAEEAAGFLAPETIATDASRSYAAFEPLG
ncbi:MAG TPA: aldehyde dehydrogenase family protein, partial [Vicinamibacteria bacterium]